MQTPLCKFHGNFQKMSGPLITGEVRLQFDVPELFLPEIENIISLLKNHNLLVVIYDMEEGNNIKFEEASVAETFN